MPHVTRGGNAVHGIDCVDRCMHTVLLVPPDRACSGSCPCQRKNNLQSASSYFSKHCRRFDGVATCQQAGHRGGARPGKGTTDRGDAGPHHGSTAEDKHEHDCLPGLRYNMPRPRMEEAAGKQASAGKLGCTSAPGARVWAARSQPLSNSDRLNRSSWAVPSAGSPRCLDFGRRHERTRRTHDARPARVRNQAQSPQRWQPALTPVPATAAATPGML